MSLMKAKARISNMPKYFGTDGVRGVAGEFITPTLAYKIGRYIGQYPNGHKNRILIARDTRISGESLAESICAGAVLSGSDVWNLGVSTTPSVSYLVRKHKFDFGVMISASHNPYYDNGIKIFNAEGEKLEASIEEEIETYIDSQTDFLPKMINEKLGKHQSVDGLLEEYIEFIASKADPAVKGLKLYVDCSNGSASNVAPKLLEKIGVKATVVSNKPNGININDCCGSTKIENNSEVVKAGDYDLAFAFDGDADRCLAMTNEGKVVDGDALMFINAIHMKKQNQLKENVVVITVMSNLGLKKALVANGCTIHETAVGDKYVQADLKKNHLSLGGEQSGHIIFLDDLNTGDGLLTMVHTLNVVAKEGKNLKDLVKELKIYPQSLKNVTVTNKQAILSHQGFKDKIAEIEASLNGNGRILVRASGTEPLIRVMCEAATKEQCEEITSVLAKYVEDIQ